MLINNYGMEISRFCLYYFVMCLFFLISATCSNTYTTVYEVSGQCTLSQRVFTVAEREYEMSVASVLLILYLCGVYQRRYNELYMSLRCPRQETLTQF